MAIQVLVKARLLEQEQSRNKQDSLKTFLRIYLAILKPAGVVDIVAGMGLAAGIFDESPDESVEVTLYKGSAPHLISKEQSWLPSVYAQPVASLGQISDVTEEVKTGLESSSPTAHTYSTRNTGDII